MTTIPYANAKTGDRAIDDIRKTLKAFGCGKFAPLEDFGESTVSIQFEYNGRMVQVTASAKGYARMLLTPKGQAARIASRKGKWTEATALEQGRVAVWSILRDWIKGQITAIECGVMPFDAAFLGQILLPDGGTVHDHVVRTDLLQIEGPGK